MRIMRTILIVLLQKYYIGQWQHLPLDHNDIIETTDYSWTLSRVAGK